MSDRPTTFGRPFRITSDANSEKGWNRSGTGRWRVHCALLVALKVEDLDRYTGTTNHL